MYLYETNISTNLKAHVEWLKSQASTPRNCMKLKTLYPYIWGRFTARSGCGVSTFKTAISLPGKAYICKNNR